jgi:MFS family permease
VKKKSFLQLLSINAYWMGLSFMWNCLHPIVLPAVLLHLAPPEAKNSYLGVLTFIGLLLAMFIQPISGAASDNWHSRWGKRRPLAVFGTSFDMLFLALLAWSGNIWVVVIGYIGLQITSNIAHGPMQGLIPDLVPKNQLGMASAIKNLMDVAGLIIASLAAGNLLAPEDRYPTIIMLVVMFLLALSALITFLTIREDTSADKVKKRNGVDPRTVFKIDIKANQNYAWLIASRFLFLGGVYGVQTFAQYYIKDVMQAANPVKATGDLMAALAVMLVICALLGGWLSDRFAPRRVIVAASLITAVGCLLLVAARDMPSLTMYAGVLGAGLGLYLTANWALASHLAPRAEAGKFLGLTNLATAGASAFSKLLGVPIDLINNAHPGKYYGYSLLFIVGSLGALLSLILLARVRDA